MRIAICDDDITELEKARKAAEDFAASKKSEHPITVNVFKNGNDLLSHIYKYNDFDLLILDILMPGINGIELAEEIRLQNTSCKIIFLTSSPEFAVKSYKVNAFYYLLKPFSDEEIKSLLNKAVDEYAEETVKSVVIKEKNRLTRIPVHTILYIESVKHTLLFHLRGNTVLTCYGSLNEFQSILLSDSRFIQCHRSFIVNMNCAISISNKDFIMEDKTLVPISKQAHPKVKKAYIDFFFSKGNNTL